MASLAIPAYAVDGVVLINQSTALAGNVTPGDAPGFPVTISVSGSYKLSGNLTVNDANINAIEINSDDVTIDLNGFSIAGAVTCSGSPLTCSPTGTGIGVSSAGHKRLTVTNGTIRGMGSSGIQFTSGVYRIEKVHTFNNGTNGIDTFSSNGLVSSCTADSNGRHGILIGSGEVSDSVTTANRLDGILVAANAVVRNNQSNHNGNNGISQLTPGGGSVFIANSATFNGSFGITAVCPALVSGNAGFGNTGQDILPVGSGCTLTSNNPLP